MKSKLEVLLSESNLSNEAKKLISEAWEAEKALIAAEIRNEMKQRYTNDKEELVEGLNTLVNKVITEGLADTNKERTKLIQDRVKIRESLEDYTAFANKILSEEIAKTRQERKTLQEGLNTFANFGVNVLTREISEMKTELHAVAEERVRLVAEGSRQIAEARKHFLDRTTEATATHIEEAVKRISNEYVSDIMEAKQNIFGRRIFETFEKAFYQTQFNKNAVLKEMNSSIMQKENDLMDTKIQLAEAEAKTKKLEDRIRIMEDISVRTATIAELTKPLTSAQKSLMEDLLKSTPTEKLNEDFNKYVNAVLKESKNSIPPNKQKPANKQKIVEAVSDVTGDRKSTSQYEPTTLTSDESNFINEIVHMAKYR